jgi:hypothetical protein
MPEVQLFNDIDEVPSLSAFEDDKGHEKLIVFDDFINLKDKEMKKIKEYLTSGRKFGFTCVNGTELCQYSEDNHKKC